ncbi:MAG: pre-mRNA-splicing factor ATP-dependent RNA helicase [Amphiamblys sp. WSBS2006]|nr:MAG: pre-mRNA-splicing factor ATP-dependent RNA helicase [Amphiamblys sp. WSBS2006]
MGDSPVSSHRDEIVDRIRKNKAVVVVGETGSGKSTQIPQYLLEDGMRVVVTQPRRIAAISLARRVAGERGCAVGEAVGYAVRFEKRCSSKTRLRYVTDGTLLRELCSDAARTYDVVVVDEAHERTLRTDLLLGILKQTAVRVVVMSASIDTKKFSSFFSAPVVSVSGRAFPVSVENTERPSLDYLDDAVRRVRSLCSGGEGGDVLVFVTGKEDIEKATALLASEDATVCGLHSGMKLSQQKAVLEKTKNRKIILATNIAETSLTIAGIRFVVDTCRAKKRRTVDGVDELCVELVSSAEAQQRAGRAGREAPGVCYRLLTRKEEEGLAPERVPETQQAGLSEMLLLVKSFTKDVFSFPFLDEPSPLLLREGLLDLHLLGALDSAGELTETGKAMAKYPLSPELARAVVAADGFGCTEEVSLIVAGLAVGVAVGEGEGTSDHLALLRTLRKKRPGAETRRVAQTERQLLAISKQNGFSVSSCGEHLQRILRAFITGSPRRVGVAWKGQCTTLEGKPLRISPESLLSGRVEESDFYFIFHGLFLAGSKPQTSFSSEVFGEWLPF